MTSVLLSCLPNKIILMNNLFINRYNSVQIFNQDTNFKRSATIKQNW